MRRPKVVCLVALAGLLFGAVSCEDDEEPVAQTDTIVIQLAGIKEGDIHDGVVEKDKNVATEVGNPYGAFLQAARVALGRNPGRIAVTSVAITLGGDSRGVISFADLFVGETNVFLRADVGGTVYVARVTAPTGVGPLDCEVIAGDAALAPIRDALLSGNFRVGIRGTTNRLPPDDFAARVDVRIGFAAYP
jgi:hypothetical protein